MNGRPDGFQWLGNTHHGLRHAWHPVARSAEVTDRPVRVWLLGDPYVAVRASNEILVLPDRCPHRFAPLSAGSVVEGRLTCAYHGWCFDAAGRCGHIPSIGAGRATPPRSHLMPPWKVEERYGLVFVALEEPSAPILEIDGWDGPDRYRVDMEIVEGRYSAALLIDNQIDASHFPFLHAGTFGADDGQELPPYAVERQGFGFETRFEVPISAKIDPAVTTGERPLLQYRVMRYRYQAPFQLELHLEYPMMDSSNTIAFWAQPQREDSARFYVTMLLRQRGGYTDEQLAARCTFEQRVVAEDLWLQAQFDTLALPLDVDAECHVKGDRASLEYRRILRTLISEDRQATTPNDENTPSTRLRSAALSTSSSQHPLTAV